MIYINAPNNKNPRTITGEGTFENCRSIIVIITATKFGHSNGEEIDTNNNTVAAHIMPTTTAFIPSIALNTTT